jgi:hypothetical protein
MNEQRDQTADKTVIDSYPTEDAAWAQAHKFAATLKSRGLAAKMGVTVKKASGVWLIVLVKRG